MTRSIFSAAVLGIALLPMLSTSPAHASSGTMVITTDTTLTEDHQGNILVNANKVTLDCAGHIVSGPGVPGFNGGIEVAGGLSDVTVRRCKVTGFDVNGIFGGGGATDGRFEANLAYNNGNHGMHLDVGSGYVVLHNTCRANGAIGIVLTGGTNSWIVQNTVEDNRNWAGIALFSDSHDNIVLDNISRRNALGYVLDVVQDNELRLNRAEFNLTQGFFIRNSPTTLVEFNTANDNLIGIEITEGSDSNRIRGNVMDRNTGDGFRIFASNKNHVEGNTGNANGGIGFLVFGGSSTNTLNRNSGHRNGSLDALDDGSGSGNVWTKNHFGKTSGF